MIGTVLRVRYEITQVLTETALFQVFAAKDRLHGREVCVRLLKAPYSHEPEFVERLSSTIQTVFPIQQPNLERLYSVDGEEGEPFIVSELSRGTTLSERLRKLGSLSVAVSVETAVVICEAVQALHSNKLCHGDIGAHNVVISPEGEAKVQMAGVWQAYSFSQTAGEAVLPLMAQYLAPEVSRGSMPSVRSDVYSIGVLLYEMLSGRLPFHADNPATMAMKHVSEAAPNVRMMNPSVPVVLAEIVRKTMAKDPQMRYENAGDLLSDLRILQDALKFGRTLTWPIREENQYEVEPVQVAPKMSVAREETKPKPVKQTKEGKPKREKDDSDVPTWLKMLIAFFAGLMAVMVIIWFVYNINKPKVIRIPDTRRLTFSEAMTRFGDLNLKVRVAKRRIHESIPAEHVITSSPAPGEQAKEGSTVSLYISLGSEYVEVPKVVGETLDQAKAMLGSLNLEVSSDVEEVTSTKPPGTVLEQDPKPGTKSLRTSSVRLKVAKRKGGMVVKNPNIKYTYNFRITLAGVQFPVEVKVVMTDAKGSRTIHQQTHDPEEIVDLIAEGFGEKATLRIYYDGAQMLEREVDAEDVVQEDR